MHGRQRVKKQNFKKWYLLAFVFLLLCMIGAGFSFDAYQTYSASYREDVSLAQGGIQYLRQAQTLLTGLSQASSHTDAVSQAHHQLFAALTQFVRLEHNLNSLPSISTSLPIYGMRLQAALHLVPMAIDISEAGIAACDLLNVFLVTPLNVHGPTLTPGNMRSAAEDFQHIKRALDQAMTEANQVPVDSVQFYPQADKMLTLFQQQIPTIRVLLDTIDQLIPVIPLLLGMSIPTNYFLEVLDSTELRPGGGFIGNYGTVTLSGGRLASAHITDVSLIDSAFRFAGNKIPYPSVYSWFPHFLGQGSWSLRDSNLDADFPTDAAYAEQNYVREGGNIPLQGVIAITPTFIEHVLDMTGPIAIPEYAETVTAQNLIERIHYHQLGSAGEGSGFVASPDGHSSLRKRFTELLAEHLLAHIQKLSSLPSFLSLLISSVRSKDIQLYFNTKSAEDVLQRLHLDGKIQSPAGDSLLHVDANLSPNKANHFLVTSVDDEVTIDGVGSATHHVAMTYAWTIAGHNYGHPLYRDYGRIYVPPGSTLQSQVGWQPQGTSSSFGREVWAGFFTLTQGQTRTMTFTWTVPRAAARESRGWHYHYLIQRQAGIEWMMHVHILLPSCASVTAATNTSGGTITTSKQSVTLTTALDEDTNFDVNYTC